MRRPFVWLVLVGVVLAVTAAVLMMREPAPGGESDTLVVAFPREVRTLDGNYSNARELDILGLLVDDALFQINPETLAVEPLSALSYRFVDDLTLDVELRTDVTFHDGTPMTARDVVYTYSWLLDERSHAEFSTRFRRWLERVEALGPHTVRFHMKTPNALVLYDLAMYSKIRPVGTYHDPHAPDGVSRDAFTRTINGTGPYRVVEFQSGDRVRLERYEGYRASSPKQPGVERMLIRVIPDFSTQAAEMVAGGVDWTFNVPTDLAEDVARTGRANFVAGPSMRAGYIVFDAAGFVVPDGPLTHADVRRALNLAIDREAIVNQLVRGRSRALHTPCIPVQFGCDQDVARYPYDPGKARRLLAQAGYADGFTLDVWAARDKEVVEAVVAMWAQVGVRARLRYVKSAALAKGIEERQAAAYFTSYGSFGIPDAGASLPDRMGGDNANTLHDDEVVKRALRDSFTSYDPQVRRAAFTRALSRIASEAYVAPIYEYTQNFLISPEVEYHQPADGMPRLYLARWRNVRADGAARGTGPGT